MVKKIIITILALIYSLNIHAGNHISPTNMFNSNQWTQFVNELRQDPDQDLYIVWGGLGGYVSIEFNFIQYMLQEQQKGRRFIFLLYGETASAQATAACIADELDFTSPKAFLMFHPLNIGRQINKDPNNITVQDTKRILSYCVYKHILTWKMVDKSLTTSQVYVREKSDGYYYLIKPDPRQQ